MTDRLEEIRKRCDAATPGTWEFTPQDMLGNARVWGPDGDAVAVAHGSLVNDVDGTQIAEFIAHSREDIPYLLSELERANRMLEACCEQICDHSVNKCILEYASDKAKEVKANGG